MWFGVLISLVTQAAKVDQVNGTWALVELWDGQLVDIHAEFLGPHVNEGQMLVLARSSSKRARQVHWDETASVLPRKMYIKQY